MKVLFNLFIYILLKSTIYAFIYKYIISIFISSPVSIVQARTSLESGATSKICKTIKAYICFL